jgi:hypothetical protein
MKRQEGGWGSNRGGMWRRGSVRSARELKRGSGGRHRHTSGGGGWRLVKQGHAVGVRYGVTDTWAGPGRRKENGLGPRKKYRPRFKLM